MVGLKPSDVPPPLGVKMLSAGAAACIADLITFPLDTAKVRLQVDILPLDTVRPQLERQSNLFSLFTSNITEASHTQQFTLCFVYHFEKVPLLITLSSITLLFQKYDSTLLFHPPSLSPFSTAFSPPPPRTYLYPSPAFPLFPA